MAYCSQSDLLTMISQEELAELTADLGDLPDPFVVAEVIAQAEAEIDVYLGSRYALPLTPTPPRLKALAVDMTIYQLYSRRSAVPAVRRERYAAAVAFLKAVAAGNLSLEASEEAGGAAGEVAGFASEGRLFSRTTLKDW